MLPIMTMLPVIVVLPTNALMMDQKAKLGSRCRAIASEEIESGKLFECMYLLE